MNVRFLQEAQAELDDAIEYYNHEYEGLGLEFLHEVLNAIERAQTFPTAWHPLSENTRRCQTRRFPYGIIYSVLKDTLLIISVSHLHRKPNHWKNRI